MRALFDAKEMTAVGTGLARYERELLRRLTAATEATTIVRRQAVADGSAAGLVGGVFVVPDWVPNIIVEQIVVPAVAWRRRPEVIHSLAGNAPVLPVPGKLVITFHEDRGVYYRNHPPQGVYPRLASRWQVWSGRRALRKAVAVLTVSETSARVARELVNRPAGEIVGVPHGVSEAFRFPKPIAEPEPFVLALASGDPRDDLQAAVDGLAPLGGRISLVVAGNLPAVDQGRLRQAAERAKVDIRFTGAVSDEALADLYHRCLCYLHASSFEGFGLAVAEAMGCGAVVIGRPSEAFEEVAGSEGLTITTPEDFTAAVECLLHDPARRQALAAAAIARASRFDWASVFRCTLDSYG